MTSDQAQAELFSTLEGFWWAKHDGKIKVVEYNGSSWYQIGSDSPIDLDLIGPKIEPPKHVKRGKE